MNNLLSINGHARFWRVLLNSLLGLVFILSACNISPTPQPTDQPDPTQSVPTPVVEVTPTPLEPSLLSICLGQEPAYLFAFADNSLSAQAVRAAIYDGPVELRDYSPHPVILAEIPSLENGAVFLERVEVAAGALIADPAEELINAALGVRYSPPGCREAGCQVDFPASGAAVMEQLVVRFRLMPGLFWSDGAPLTTADSVYSYDVARLLFPNVRPDLLRYTDSYQALDDLTIEWRGIPGYQSSSLTSFLFSPLPQHAWSGLSPQDFLTAPQANLVPLGWGAYKVDSWTSGDHITLSKNPYYWRAPEGLPLFDRLVFRFIPDSAQAVQALLAGECDILDGTALAGASFDDLRALQDSGSARLLVGQAAAWEHLDFNLAPLDQAQLNIFQSKDVRHAAALCIDRQALVEQVFKNQAQTLSTYLPASHPLFSDSARQYPYDPAGGSALLDQAGWLDLDGDPGTPRTSSGAAGFPDGLPLQFTYQTISGTLREQAAGLIRLNLAQCGFQADIQLSSWEDLFAPGPDGSVFGRRFEAVQFAWTSDPIPPCYLYTSQQIPGPYPQFARGWGGANLTGYSNPEVDRLCRLAGAALPETSEYQQAQRQLQEILAEDLPMLPLYQHPGYLLTRVGICGLEIDPSTGNFYAGIEVINMQGDC